MLLARYKGVALTQLHQELLQISDDGTFKIALQIVLILGNTQELGNDRVLDELETVCLKFGSFVLHFNNNRLSILRHEKALVIERAYIAIKSAHAPILLDGFFLVPITNGFLVHTEKHQVVRPRES